MGGYTKISKARLERALKTIQWYPQGGEGKPLYALVPSVACVATMSSILDISYNIVGIHFKRAYMSWYFDAKHLNRMAKTFLKRYDADKKYFEKLYVAWQLDLKKFYKTIEVINKKDFEPLGNKKLVELFTLFVKEFTNVWNYFIFIDCFDPKGECIVADYLRKYKLSIADSDLKILLSSNVPSYVAEEKKAFLEIAIYALKHKKDSSAIQKLLAEHQKRFYWHMNNYGTIQYLTIEDFYKKLNNLLQTATVKSLEREIAEIKKNARIPELKKQLVKKYKVPKDINGILNFFAYLTQCRDERKKMNLIGLTTLRYLAYKISKRLQVDVGDLEYLAPWEMKRVFALSRKELLEIRDRKEASFWIFDGKRKIYFFTLEEADRLKKFLDDLLIKEHSELKGLGVSLGIGRGIVKVVTLVKEFGKMHQGNILVTQMTRPEFTPIMKKAAAIITNEGGITSHAAIVSRELGIPCVIGTKVATTILKDGDLVEVDADKGVVRKIV